MNFKDLIENIPITDLEYTPQLRVFGYKALLFHPQDSPWLFSPSYRVYWEDGELEADAPPDRLSTDYSDTTYHGIHFTKTYNNHTLVEYATQGVFKGMYVYLVECELDGDIVETEKGYRSQYAKITRGIFIDHTKCHVENLRLKYTITDYHYVEDSISKELENGNWKSYQEIYHTTQEAYRRERIASWEARYYGEWRDRE